MGFGEAITTGFKKTFVYQGRASLSEFWWFQLFHVVSVVALFFLFCLVLFLTGPGTDHKSISPVAGLMGMVLFLYVFGMLLPLVSVAVRRLHDSDKTGVLLLIAFVPFGGLVLLAFYCLSGTRGPNKYGNDPLRPETTAAQVF